MSGQGDLNVGQHFDGFSLSLYPFELSLQTSIDMEGFHLCYRWSITIIHHEISSVSILITGLYLIYIKGQTLLFSC